MGGSKTRRFQWIVALAILCSGAVSIGYGCWRLSEITAERHVNVSPELSLNVVTVLSKDFPQYPPPRPRWKRELISRLPRKIVKRFPDIWKTDIPSFEVEEDEVQIIAELQYPDNWDSDEEEGYRRIQQILAEQGLQGAYLEFPNGYTTLVNKLYPTGLYNWNRSSKKSRVLKGLTFEVPPNQHSFELHFAKVSPSGETTPSHIKPISLPGPSPEKITPLTPAPLPITVTHDGVSVTLRGLGTKCRADYQNIFATDGRSANEVLLNGEFFKADGTLSDPYHAIAVFEIRDHNSTTSQWGVQRTVSVSFGDPQRYFDAVNWKPIQPPSQTAVFDNDFGVLEQAVNVHVSLVRQDNFPADECQVVTMPLPGEVEYMKMGSMQFWDDQVSLYAGNEVLVTDDITTKSSDCLCLHASYGSPFTGFHVVELRTPGGGSINLLEYRVNESYSMQSHTLQLDLKQALEAAGASEAEAKGSTLTVTLVRARQFPHQFKFTALPSEAKEESTKP